MEKGFAAMTVAEIANRAKVSPQTVYAVFTSKTGILMAVIEDRVHKDERNADALKLLQTSHDPVLMLRSIAKLICNIYENNTDPFASSYGTRMVSRELARLEDEIGEHRRQRQYPLAASLHASGKLLPHLSENDVRDILWVLTSREIYYLFVVKRGWPIERYEEQLYSMLTASLMGREAAL